MQRFNSILNQAVKKIPSILLNFLPLISLVVPFIIIYFYQGVAFPPYPYMLYPPDVYTDTFETVWKGRAFYFFFVWFACLEIIFGWERLQFKVSSDMHSVRTITFILSLLFPTIYAVVANFYGLNVLIKDWTYEITNEYCDWMPLAVEYLVFALAFVLVVFLQYGNNGLKTILCSPILLGVIGILYTIDNVFPYGHFMPFQILTPITVILAEIVLNFLGYKTSIIYITDPKYEWMPVLTVWNSKDPVYSRVALGIAWVCSGVESLMLYTLLMLFFLRNIDASRRRKVAYFIVGAVITYLINILRIVTLFILAMNFGVNSLQFHRFHDYHSQLISILWIALYPLIITGRSLWGKITSFL